MRFLMDFMSGVCYFINQAISEAKYSGLKEFNFEAPLTRLIWIASILCITTSFGMSWLLIGDITVGRRGIAEAVVAIGVDHQLRHAGGRADSRIHQGVHQLALEARA